MNVPFFRALSKKGLPPGTLLAPPSSPTQGPTEIELIEYSMKELSIEPLPTDVSQWRVIPRHGCTAWLNIVGLHDIETLKGVGNFLSLDPLVLEDVINMSQRSKLEFFEDYHYLVFRSIRFDPESLTLESEQISFVIDDRRVVSFQENKKDDFDYIRKRLHKGGPRLRDGGADYLLYALLDAIADHYLVVLDQIGGVIQELERSADTHNSRDFLMKSNRLRDALILMRTYLRPIRDLSQKLLNDHVFEIQQKNVGYYRDLSDHCEQAYESTQLFLELVRGARDYHLNLLSLSGNEVMKFLTLFASIFIPLTFIAGIYGMNFEHMPELDDPWAYPAVLTLMLSLAVFLLLFFKKKRWL